jgi:hypothetical protein
MTSGPYWAALIWETRCYAGSTPGDRGRGFWDATETESACGRSPIFSSVIIWRACCSLVGSSRSAAPYSVWCRVLLQWRSDDVLHLCGVPVVQLRDYIVEFSSLNADGHEGELSLSLSKPHGWPLGPKRW